MTTEAAWEAWAEGWGSSPYLALHSGNWYHIRRMENTPNMGGNAPQQPQHEQHQQSSAPHEAKPMGAPHFDPKDVSENKLIAALSYIGILCLIPLLAKKESKYCQEHGKQGLVLVIAWIILFVIGIVPVLGWIIAFFGNIVFLIIAIVALIKCLMGEFWEIPVIGQYRHKLNI